MGILRRFLLALSDVASEGLECPFGTPRMAEHWEATRILIATQRDGHLDGMVAKKGPHSVYPCYLARRLHSRSSLVAEPDLS